MDIRSSLRREGPPRRVRRPRNPLTMIGLVGSQAVHARTHARRHSLSTTTSQSVSQSVATPKKNYRAVFLLLPARIARTDLPVAEDEVPVVMAVALLFVAGHVPILPTLEELVIPPKQSLLLDGKVFACGVGGKGGGEGWRKSDAEHSRERATDPHHRAALHQGEEEVRLGSDGNSAESHEASLLQETRQLETRSDLLLLSRQLEA